KDIERVWHATCVARRDGAATEDQAAMRRSCLERRELELDARVRQLAAGTDDLHIKIESAGITPVDQCLEIVAPPIRDRVAVAALFRKLVELTPNNQAALRVAPAVYETFGHDAAALGERELAAKALLLQARSLRDLDQFDAAEAALQRSYKEYVDLHDT